MLDISDIFIWVGNHGTRTYLCELGTYLESGITGFTNPLFEAPVLREQLVDVGTKLQRFLRLRFFHHSISVVASDTYMYLEKT